MAETIHGRRYMSKADVEKHLKSFDNHKNKFIGRDPKIDKLIYLEKILSKRGLLDSMTRDSVEEKWEDLFLSRNSGYKNYERKKKLSNFRNEGLRYLKSEINSGDENRKANAERLAYSALERSYDENKIMGSFNDKLSSLLGGNTYEIMQKIRSSKRHWGFGMSAIIGLGAGIFFLSPNLTGNVIGNLTNSASNIIGLVSFVIGVIGAFFYFRRR